MARKGRIEFSGAVYHVLDRGDRRQAIVRNDQDRDQAAFVGDVSRVSRCWDRDTELTRELEKVLMSQ
jgi:hypothetical protein